MSIGPDPLRSRGNSRLVDYSNSGQGRGQGRGRGRGRGHSPPNIMSTPVEAFETNPFATDINPASTTGLKLFQAATQKAMHITY